MIRIEKFSTPCSIRLLNPILSVVGTLSGLLYGSVQQVLQILRRLGPAGWVTVLSGTLPPILGMTILATSLKLAPWLDSHRPLSVFLTAAAFMLAGGMMLAPTYSFSWLCGLSFGFSVGLATGMTAITGAALINYAWARAVCKDRITTLLDENPKSRAVHNALLHGSPLKTFGIVTLLRLPPTSPFALANVLLAATKVPFVTVFFATLLGMLPRTAIVVAAGAGLESLDPDVKKNPLVWAAGIVVTIIVLMILTAVSKKALAQATATPSAGAIAASAE